MKSGNNATFPPENQDFKTEAEETCKERYFVQRPPTFVGNSQFLIVSEGDRDQRQELSVRPSILQPEGLKQCRMDGRWCLFFPWCDPGTSQTPQLGPDWFSICGPVTERWIYWPEAASCSLRRSETVTWAHLLWLQFSFRAAEWDVWSRQAALQPFNICFLQFNLKKSEQFSDCFKFFYTLLFILFMFSVNLISLIFSFYISNLLLLHLKWLKSTDTGSESALKVCTAAPRHNPERKWRLNVRKEFLSSPLNVLS